MEKLGVLEYLFALISSIPPWLMKKKNPERKQPRHIEEFIAFLEKVRPHLKL